MNQIKERVIVYIDGYNLYYGLKSKYGRKYMWLNLLVLSNNLIRNEQELIRVKYFTTLVKKSEQKVERQKRFISALNTLPKSQFQIYEGRFQDKEITCPKENCGYKFSRPEEKKTDVCISVEMVRDAYTDCLDWCFLVSADSDLIPAVTAVQAAGKKVFVIFPPNRHSAELYQNANSRMNLGLGIIKKSMFPNPCIANDGRKIWKPVLWS